MRHRTLAVKAAGRAPLATTSGTEISVNVPAVLASILLTTLPILILYAIGRRQLLSGLTAGFSE